MSLQIVRSLNLNSYQREYYNLMAFMADLGGLHVCLFGIGATIVGLYSKFHSNDRMVAALFKKYNGNFKYKK